MIKISFSGDLMALIPENKAAWDGKTFNYEPVFKEVSNIFKDSSYVVGNLETPIAGENLGWTCDETVFNTPLEFANAAKKVGFTCFSISNNHCLDRGIQGLNDTIDNLDKLGLDHTGCYKTNADADKILIREIEGIKFAFLSFTYGTNSEWRNNKLEESESYRVDLFLEQKPFNNIKVNKKLQKVKGFIKSVLPQSIREKIQPIVIKDCIRHVPVVSNDNYYKVRLSEKIKKAKEKADVVIMLMHSGGQYNSEIGEYTSLLTKELVNLGCDIIIGNHPHCVLPYDIIDGKLVTYSLGNFCFTPNYGFYYKGVYADYSVVLHLYFNSNKEIEKKSIEICKVVNQKNGHSVVIPTYNLLSEMKGKKYNLLVRDIEQVVSRFMPGQQSEADILQKEIFF